MQRYSLYVFQHNFSTRISLFVNIIYNLADFYLFKLTENNKYHKDITFLQQKHDYSIIMLSNV